jgi:phosphate/sulfate permease
MNERIYWSLGVGLLGLLLVQKGTYWFSVTYLHDTVNSVLGAFGGAIIGFLLGCIVENTTDERSRRFKVLYWLLVMAIFGSFLGFGKGVPVSMTMTVLASTLGIGLLIGLIQYFLQRPRPVAQ